MMHHLPVRCFVRSLLRCACLVALLPFDAAAQNNKLEENCVFGGTSFINGPYCNLVAQAVEVAQPRLGLALIGGNPVAGTASTMGQSVVALPRFSVIVRGTGVSTKLPAIGSTNNPIKFVAPSGNIDASFGLFSGIGVGPTVTGLMSFDLLASLGILPLPGGKGFTGGTAKSYAGGVRLGIIRESFTAPGISISGMFRHTGDITYGDAGLRTSDAFFKLSGLNTISVRGAVGKRLGVIGATAGVGYDSFQSDVEFGAARGTINARGIGDGYEDHRTLVFGNLSWTMLVFTAALEGGWQSGGKASTATIPAGAENVTGKGTPFGSIALRLTL